MEMLPKSAGSSSGSPGHSPGSSFQDSTGPKVRLNKKESLRLKKRSYKEEKKKAYQELKSTIQDPSIVIFSDWLKIRSNLKNWSRMWCVLKPGMLVLYKSSKQKQWAGTILLTSSEIIERPSKKDGFCFKIYHPLEQMIWAVKGPKGEGMSLLSNSLPSNHLILRAATESDGRCWMDAIELARKCSHLIKKSMSTSEPIEKNNDLTGQSYDYEDDAYSIEGGGLDVSLLQQQLNILRNNKMFTSDENNPETKSEDGSNILASDDSSEKEVVLPAKMTTNASISSQQDNSSCSSEVESIESQEVEKIVKSTYVLSDVTETFGDVGESAQTEVLAGENKSLIWTLLKQLRPGMDLSKVVLPTFILEPRSFLEKLSDYYYHADIISDAAKTENPFERIKGVTKWYLSGFYKKPRGLKKPYNPILGETFRCKWENPDTDSHTYYIAEQVSHHPPISAFAVVNRKDGFVINGSILAKSKFYGNSLSAILEGDAILSLLSRGEDYIVTMPYAHCKGILYGTMTMELGGKVQIFCKKTGYCTEIEFKLKPFFGGSDVVNRITGRILLGKEVLATLSGYWDREVYITDLATGSVTSFWKPTPEIKQNRLKRYTVAIDEQGEYESEKLWQHVTFAINNCDQEEATMQKYILEENQRKQASERKNKNVKWLPKLFQADSNSQKWMYKFLDKRPWDNLNDIEQYETNGCIATRTRHRTNKLILRETNCALENFQQVNNDESPSTVELIENQNIQVSEGRDETQMFSAFKENISCIQERQILIMRELGVVRKLLEKQETARLDLMSSKIIVIFLFVLLAFLAYCSNK